MFKLNFKIALRNIWKNKTSSLINISGLAIGLAACLILLLWASYHLNFDKQAKDQERVFQVMMNHKGANGGISLTGQSTANVIAPLLKQKYSWIEAACRLSWASEFLIANGINSFKKRGEFADPSILDIFDYTFIQGNPKTALLQPNSVIITASTAKVLFGSTDVLNRSVRFQDRKDLIISGVIQDPEVNQSRTFDYLMPWSVYESEFVWVKEPKWENFNYTTLVKLRAGAGVQEANKTVKTFYQENGIPKKAELFLFPFSRLHLHDKFVNGVNTGGAIEEVHLFIGLAIGILLIACINFMNMATAKSEKRAKEVGIRKTIGASRSSLISQFLIESLVLTMTSAVFAVIFLEMSLPYLNQLLEIRLGINYSDPVTWMGVTAVVLVTAFMAGSYPAFYLSAFNPVQVLKKRGAKKGALSVNLRQVLVVGQFCFAVVLIIATTVIYRQIQYIRDRPVGYQMDGLVEISQEGQLSDKYEILKGRLMKSGAVNSVLESSTSISREMSSSSGAEWPGSSEDDKLIRFNTMATTYGFMKTTGAKILYGRDFSPDFPSDTNGLLISHSAMKVMNLKDPVGKIVKHDGIKSNIVGVFEDIILGSPSDAEKPLIIGYDKEWNGMVTLRLNPLHSVADNIATISKIVKQINPAYPVEIKFVDELYVEKIKSQTVLGILSNIAGALAIFISCLGLFGLAAYSAEQRTKELGIRKVLGASVPSLMKLLSLSFLKMVVIAIIIAVPLANYIMSSWLKSFEFHTSVNWVIILLAAAGTIGVALFTVSFQAYRAAKANPVDSLKYE